MTRPLRLHGCGLIYHVMARGNARMPIYRDDHDHRRFLDLLEHVVQRYALKCWVYCLMPNHYHLVVQATDDNLSLAMRQLNGVYAQWWNRRHERVGHVTQGRFKAQVVQEERYLLAVCRYVLLNPVRAGLASKADAWEWSSAAATLGQKEGRPFLSPGLLLDACGGADPASKRARLAAVLATDQLVDVSTAIRDDRRVIGDEAFVDRFRERLTTVPDDITRQDRRLLARPSLEGLLMATTGGALSARVARALAAGHTVQDVADAFGVGRDAIDRLARPLHPGRRRRGDGGARPGTPRPQIET